MFLLLSTIEDGFPEYKHQLPPSTRESHQFEKHLYSSDGIVIYKNHIVIPNSLRPTCLSAQHTAHQGTSAMTAKTQVSVSGLASQIPFKTSEQIVGSATGWPHPMHMCRLLPVSGPQLPFHFRPFSYSNLPIVKRTEDGATGLIMDNRARGVG